MTYSLDDLRQRLSRLDDDVTHARAEYEAAGQRLAEAEKRRSGAAAFIALLEQEADASPAEPPAMTFGPLPRIRKGSPATGVTAMVEEIMRAHPDGIDIHDVQRIAGEQGHDLNGEQVRSAVTYLRRRGDAENVGRGVWRLKPGASTQDSDGPASARPFAQAPPPTPSEVGAG